MKQSIRILLRLVFCLFTANYATSCATSSLLGSRTRHVGTIHAIKECRADDHHAYVLFQMEKGGPWETYGVDLKTRNASVVKKTPDSARVVPVVRLADESAAPSRGRGSPCLGIWPVHPDRPDSPLVPRVHWISRDRDFCVNLPSKAAEPGKIVSRLPLAVVQDTVTLGLVGVTLINPYGPGAATGAVLEGWNSSADAWTK